MKSLHNFQKQKGLTAIELLIAVSVALLVSFLLIRPAMNLLGLGKSAEIQTHISELRAGVLAYRAQTGVCTGASVAELVNRGLINADWATVTNPWGGSYTVGCSGSNITQFAISTSGVADDAIGRQVAGAYASKVISANYASGTLTLVVQG